MTGHTFSIRLRDAGFTLIEVLVVIVVLGVLAGLVAPDVFRNLGASKDTAARAQIEMLGAALDSYRLDNDRYPTTEQGLEALRREPSSGPAARNWRGPYLRREIPLDPWGRPYEYRSPGVHDASGFELVSHGRGGAEPGEGADSEVRSWE